MDGQRAQIVTPLARFLHRLRLQNTLFPPPTPLAHVAYSEDSQTVPKEGRMWAAASNNSLIFKRWMI